MQTAVPQPTYLNLEYFFNKIAEIVVVVWAWITSATLHSVIHFLMIFFSILFIVLICYTLVRVLEIQAHEKHELYHIIGENLAHEAAPMVKNPKWAIVLNHINSTNPSDWRLAIIEADAILDELLYQVHPEGDNLGDRLTAMESGDFATLAQAREAHGVRNKIAHQGSDFNLPQREARRIMGLYEQVFKEFDFI